MHFKRTIARYVWMIIAMSCAMLCNSCDQRYAEKVVIRFWNGFTGPDGRTMLALVQRFNNENPDVQVIMQRMEWGTYYNKLFVAGLGGRSPEVFVVHTDSLRRFVGAGLVKPLDADLAMAKFDVGDFDPNVWSAVEHQGRHYAVPLDVHLLGMYYNRKLFAEAGITDAPRNLAEFLDALRKLKKDSNNDGRPEQWGFVFTWMRTNCYALIRQNGGDVLERDGSRATLSDRKAVEAIEFASDLIRKEKLAPGPENFDAWIGFRQGKVGIVFEGIYMLPELQRQTDLDFGAAPLPVLFDQPAAFGNSHNLCLRSDLIGAEHLASMRFVKFLSDSSLEWSAGGQVPVRRSLRESNAFKSEARFAAQREFAKQIPYAAYMPSVPFVFEYLVEYDLAIEQSLRGSSAPETALSNASARIENVIERYRNAGALPAEVPAK